MNKKVLDKVTFVGRPFPDSLIDEQKTFTQANMQMESDPVFQKFLKDNNLENNRANMVVFGPENFMYWYGVLAPNVENIPGGLMKFELQKAKVAQEESDNQSLSAFSMPLNATIQAFLKKLIENGVKVYENIGDSDTPYVVQDLDLGNKKLTQTLYLKASE